MAATLRTPARTASPPARARLAERLFVQVDNTWMVVFRILFGLIAGWEVYRYFSNGWIVRYWVAPTQHFTYYGFDWVRPLPPQGMVLLWVTLGVLAVGITLGVFYRFSAALFCLGFAYSFLLEATRYLNHFYLIALLAGLLAVVPAHQRLSVDAWQRPSLRSDTAPAWTLWLLRFQVGIVYVFGGVAKLNGDWLRGEPMRTWLAARTGFPMIGRWFESEWLVWGFSYGGLLLDLAIVPLLLMRRTRAIALVALLIFNGLNDRLFSIGVFPYLALGAALLFCDPPRRWSLPDAPAPAAPEPAARTALRVGSDHRGVILALLAAHVVVQLVVPLRHLAYPGVPNWTEEGHQFAWHMKLRSKSGQATFTALEPATGQTWVVDPANVLESWQVDKVAVRPELLRQFAVALAAGLEAEGHAAIEVRADAWASLNGREPQRLVDPTVDLAAQPPSLAHRTWIVPLTEPLPRP